VVLDFYVEPLVLVWFFKINQVPVLVLGNPVRNWWLAAGQPSVPDFFSQIKFIYINSSSGSRMRFGTKPSSDSVFTNQNQN
jgi:hypothetical protein